MPTTTRGYPYPAGGDPAATPANLQALAAAIDTDVSGSVGDLFLGCLNDIGAHVQAVSTMTVGTANNAIVGVFRPRATVTPTKFCFWITTSSGNYDIAIVRVSDRARLWSQGSTASPGTGAQVRTITSGPTLAAGTKYALAIAADNTTFAIRASATFTTGMGTLYDGSLAYGLSASAFPIPATVPAWTEALNAPALTLRA